MKDNRLEQSGLHVILRDARGHQPAGFGYEEGCWALVALAAFSAVTTVLACIGIWTTVGWLRSAL